MCQEVKEKHTPMSAYHLVQDIFDHVPVYFRPEMAENVQVTAQFNITGEQGGDWLVQVAEGRLSVGRGVDETAEFVVTASAADVLRIANGNLNPLDAYLGGKLKISGDLRQGYRLQGLFHIPSRLQGLL